ncbi:GGDEF domain-containing protein [Actinoplanes sp. NPDC051851]|uniref:GGDEF domain-containing protein n=1 Tax=Actinoplanes sp. NPDC051851 TaxID=3154753 RepID=UPI00344A2DD2
MRKNWLRLPAGNVERARLAAVGIGSVAMTMQIPQVGNVLRSVAYQRMSMVAIAVLVIVCVVVYLRKRAYLWTLPLIPVLSVLGASGLKDPLAGMSLAIFPVVLCSLYGSTRVWLIRALTAMASVPVALAISPRMLEQEMPWHSPSVLGLVPQILLMSALTRAFYVGLRRQERAAARDATVAQAGRLLLAATDAAEIRRIGEEAGEALLRLHPGVVLMIVYRAREGLTLAYPVERRGRVLAAGPAPQPGELSRMMPGFTDWHVDPLGEDPETAGLYMVVGGRRAVPAEVLDAFRSVSYQVILGEQSLRARAELEYSAHHDHLTGLPTRAKFLRAVDEALALDRPVALLNVDLDGFKQVNDDHGHATGDDLLVHVATRLAAAAGPHGLAARFGGDEFAVLLFSPEGAPEIAARLCAELAEPVRLRSATIRPGASIGVALASPGVTVTELMHRADVAMYAAKAAGKSRVVLSDPVAV